MLQRGEANGEVGLPASPPPSGSTKVLVHRLRLSFLLASGLRRSLVAAATDLLLLSSLFLLLLKASLHRAPPPRALIGGLKSIHQINTGFARLRLRMCVVLLSILKSKLVVT